MTPGYDVAILEALNRIADALEEGYRGTPAVVRTVEVAPVGIETLVAYRGALRDLVEWHTGKGNTPETIEVILERAKKLLEERQ